MNKLVVSGGSGFVGKNLTDYLTRLTSFNLVNLNLRTSPIILESKALATIHLAGKAHDLKQISAFDDYYTINFNLTKQLYDEFLDSEQQKFVFISSVKAVTDSVNTILTEDCSVNPQTHYGKSKLLAEKYIQSKPLPEGKSYYILRPCMIHGPGNKGNLNLLYNFVVKGLPYPLASFNNKRSFLSVENLCFIIKEIVEREDIPSGIYNVADDEPLSTTEVVQLLSKSMEKRAKLLEVPKALIQGIARLGDKFHLPLNTERLQKLTENYIVDNSKIKQVLKKTLPLSAREGILKTARSFKDA